MKTFQHQGKHLLALLLLLIPVVWYSRLPGNLQGGWLGLSTKAWYWIAVAIPIVHQLGVMLAWRFELYHQTLSSVLGKRAFYFFQVFFFPGLVARPISVLILAMADRGSSAAPAWLLSLIVLAMTPILLYLLYSIVRYFGISRAAGADHFLAEYREKPLVQEGIFRYLPNAMYVGGFFAVWIPALVLASNAGLLTAAFQHALIWAHYRYTEKPDMQEIYATHNTSSSKNPEGWEGS
jgi:hypothetical protein